MIDYFPENEHFTRSAEKKLAEIYLRRGDYHQAMTIFERFAASGKKDVSFRAYGMAGKSFVLAAQGNLDESAVILKKLHPILDSLGNPQMRRLVEYAEKKTGLPRKPHANPKRNFKERKPNTMSHEKRGHTGSTTLWVARMPHAFAQHGTQSQSLKFHEPATTYMPHCMRATQEGHPSRPVAFRMAQPVRDGAPLPGAGSFRSLRYVCRARAGCDWTRRT